MCLRYGSSDSQSASSNSSNDSESSGSDSSTSSTAHLELVSIQTALSIAKEYPHIADASQLEVRILVDPSTKFECVVPTKDGNSCREQVCNSRGSIEKHLRSEEHYMGATASFSVTCLIGPCGESGKGEGRTMKFSSYPKHVQDVHWKSLRAQCLHCDQIFTRKNKVESHMIARCKYLSESNAAAEDEGESPRPSKRARL